MANAMTFDQLATVLTAITKQVTGQQNISVTDTSSFVNVGQLALSAGYDPVLNAINQMIARTIFSVRPYRRKFQGLSVTNEKYGMVTRKIAFADQGFDDNEEYELEDGQSYDMYKVKKPSALQLNFYGIETYHKSTTVFKDQLDSAFTGPDQLNSFLSAQMQNINDVIEQAHESTARMTIANLMGGILAERDDTPQVVHLLTEYNEETGQTLTYEQIMGPQYFSTFWPWVFGRVKDVASMLTERLATYHINIDSKPVLMRHTPYSDQHIYMNQKYFYKTASQLLPFAFSDNGLQVSDFEGVNFWQSSNSPYAIQVTPSVLDHTTGNVKKAAEVNQDHILGVIFDREAAGMTTVNQWQATTPLNTLGGYWNTDWHWAEKYWNDFTENAVVFVID